MVWARVSISSLKTCIWKPDTFTISSTALAPTYKLLMVSVIFIWKTFLLQTLQDSGICLWTPCFPERISAGLLPRCMYEGQVQAARGSFCRSKRRYVRCEVGNKRPRQEKRAGAERPRRRGLGHIVITQRKGGVWTRQGAEGRIDSRNK